jgi:phage terminase large subunit-like protein
MSNVQAALDQLARLPDRRDAIAAVLAYEKKRRQDEYIRYWEPKGPNGETIDQQASVFDEFDDGTKIFGITGGNRSGKTELGAIITVAWALGKEYFDGEPAGEYIKRLPIPPPPNNIWCVGLDFPTVRDVIWREKFVSGAAHPGLLPKTSVVRKANESDLQIFFENGSVITCKSADSGREKFQSASINLVWIDEEPDEAVYDECYQRTVDCRGKILITLTPLSDISSGVRTPWVFNLFEDMRAGQKDIKFVKLSVLDNPYVPDEEKDKLRDKWAGHFEERARLYGDFVQRSGLVYPTWNPKVHVVSAATPLPIDWHRTVCIDPAPTGPTGCLWCATDPYGNCYYYKEYLESNLVISEHAKRILIRNGGAPVDTWLIDPKMGAQRNSETHRTVQQLYRDAGIPVILAPVGEDFGISASQEYIQATLNPKSKIPKAYFFETLKNFQFEIERYSWDMFERGPLKGLSKDKPRKGNDDLIDCFRYISALRPNYRRRRAQISDEDRAKAVGLNSY